MMEIQDLPDVVLLKVFSFFSNEEKIKKLTAICKHWHWLVQNSIQQLVIYGSRPPYRLFWDALSKEEVDPKFIVKARQLTKKFTFKFRALKKLFLFELDQPHLFLISLSEDSLNQLVELKITLWPLFYFPTLESKIRINLTSLRKLCTDSAYYLEEALNTPNLESIAFFDFGCPHKSQEQIRYPENIKFLLCKFFQTKPILRNLEHLVCEQIKGELPLEEMPKLKRVEVFPAETSDFEVIEELKMQKHRLKRRDLDIWVSGFKENFTKELILFFRKRFHQNIERIDSPLDPFDHFDYNEPLSVFPNRIYFTSPHLTRRFPNLAGIPKNFFKVFVDIRELALSVPVNCQGLILFLKNARKLEKLSISQNQFEEHFFHELSRIQSIKSLFLNNILPPDADYDLGFIFNLRNLQFMHLTGQDSNIKLSTKLLIEFLKATESFTETQIFNIYNESRGKVVSVCHNTHFLPTTYFLMCRVARERVEFKFKCLNKLIPQIEKLAGKDTIFSLES